MTDAIYAIGDIHGHIDSLITRHARIKADQLHHGHTTAKIVHVGDLVDRGPDSSGVIDYLMRGQQDDQPWVVLKGNHDKMFHKFLDDPNWRDPRISRADYNWLHPMLGGLETLQSYGIDATTDRDPLDLWAEATSAVPASHQAYLANLPYIYRTETCAFVHAGIRPGVPLDAQDPEDLIWIRREFHDDPRDHDALIVHGHTPVQRACHYGNRVNIDSGVCWGREMTAIVIEGDAVFTLEDDGRHPLLPPQK